MKSLYACCSAAPFVCVLYCQFKSTLISNSQHIQFDLLDIYSRHIISSGVSLEGQRAGGKGQGVLQSTPIESLVRRHNLEIASALCECVIRHIVESFRHINVLSCSLSPSLSFFLCLSLFLSLYLSRLQLSPTLACCVRCPLSNMTYTQSFEVLFLSSANQC